MQTYRESSSPFQEISAVNILQENSQFILGADYCASSLLDISVFEGQQL